MKKDNKDFMAKCTEKYKPYSMIGLRLIAGLIFLIAGMSKLGWVGGGDLAGVAGYFNGLEIPLAGFFAALVAIVEFLGGIALILGAAPRVSAAVLGIVIIVAIFTAHWDFSEGGLAFWNGVKYPLLLLAGLATIKINGASKWAVWNKW